MIWGSGWGRDQHPQRSQNDKVIVQWERLEYSLHTFPDISTQWNVSVSGAETSKGCKSQWPIITYYTESQASFSISRCTGLFFCAPLSGKKWLRTPPSHLLFLGHFHFIKLQSVFYVCWGGNDTDPRGLTTGCSRGLRISPLCPRKDVKSQLSSAKLLIFFFSWMRGVWEISILQLSFPQ